MTVVLGEQFEMMSSDGSQIRIDSDTVKELLQRLVDEGTITQETSESCFKTIYMHTVRTNRRDSALKPKWIAPTLGANATPEMIVDQLGDVREKMKSLEKTEGFLKEALAVKLAKIEAVSKGVKLAGDDYTFPIEEGGFSTDNAG